MAGVVRLEDDAGVCWELTNRQIYLRVVRRLIKDPTVCVVLASGGGLFPELVADIERMPLWEKVKNNYTGPGGKRNGGYFLAHQFRTQDDRRMLYIEENC